MEGTGMILLVGLVFLLARMWRHMKKFDLAFIGGILLFSGYALAYGTAQEQLKRISSPAVICLKGEACDPALAEPVQTVATLPGQSKYAVCSACHGADGGGGVGPRLQGQTAEAIAEMLYAYKAGETRGAQSALMWGQAVGLSDEDIADLSEYIATL